MYYCLSKISCTKKILFPKNYHYRAKLTKDVLTGQKQLVKEVKKYFKKLTNAHVLDIGCNDGALLDFLKREMQDYWSRAY